jgi:hypothetical protein
MCSGSFDELVTVRIGRAPNFKEYQMHQGLMAHYSTVFAQMLFGTTTMRQRATSLLCLNHDTFETVMYWMYTSNFWTLGTNNNGKIALDDDEILKL